MVAFLAILTVVAIAGIAGSLSLVVRDGYRREPARALVRLF